MGTLELKQSLTGHRGRVWNVCWHPLGSCIASCGEDKTIRIWAAKGSQWVIKTILTEGHTRTIREIAWSPCGNYIASVSFDATIAIWDKKSGQFECNTTLEGHENEVKSVSWSSSGQLLATCSRDKSVWVWEITDDEYECAAVINAHSQDVKKVRWHPNKEVLASASYDNTVKIFKEDTSDSDWLCVSTLSSHTSTVWSLSFDSTGDRIASCSDDKTVKIWQVYKPENEAGIPTPNDEPVWKCVCTLSGYHTRTIYDIDWCKKTGLIVTACGDDIIRIFKEESDSDPNQPKFNMVCAMENAHTQDVNSVQWNPTEIGLLASASDDGEVKIWFYKLFMIGKCLVVELGRKLLFNRQSFNFIRSSHTMGLPLKSVVDSLNSFANLKLAASWDNVGLLIEPTDPKTISHILLTNDLTEDVMQEAVDLKTDLIISYHPPIFSPLKSITTKTWKERIAAKCLENKIALYSPHTSFDSVIGGVNDWLAGGFDLESSSPIEPGSPDPRNGFGRFCILKDSISIESAVQIVKNRIDLPHVRLARKRGSNGTNCIKTIALCAGSGTSVFKSSPPADLYLTGEMFHHDVLDLVHQGGNVILTNHSDSERGYLKVFSQELSKILDNSVKIVISQNDKDPLETV